jgi:hypothetical protein
MNAVDSDLVVSQTRRRQIEETRNGERQTLEGVALPLKVVDHVGDSCKVWSARNLVKFPEP